MASRINKTTERRYNVIYEPLLTTSTNMQSQSQAKTTQANWDSSTTTNTQQYNNRAKFRLNANQSLLSTVTDSSQIAATMQRVQLPSGQSASIQFNTNQLQLSDQPANITQTQNAHKSVIGQFRARFFKRPILPFLTASAAEELETAEQQVKTAVNDSLRSSVDKLFDEKQAVAELTRTIGTMTEYRESETQTSPYSPDFITDSEEAEPEILSLKHLRFGAGLPASQAELIFIQQMRETAAFQQQLPQGTDPESFASRKKLLEQRELAEWQLREQDMRKEQQSKSISLIQALHEREEKSNEQAAARLAAVEQRLATRRQQIANRIESQRIKVSRALNKNAALQSERLNQRVAASTQLTTSQSSRSRDIIEEYANFASTIYAHIKRQGFKAAHNQNQEYNLPTLQSTHALQELDQRIQRHNRRQEVLNDVIGSEVEDNEKLLHSQIERINSLAEFNRQQHHQQQQKHNQHNRYKQFQTQHRPTTPSIQQQTINESTLDSALILLQRLLRGRTTQQHLTNTRQHEQHLIKELRTQQQRHNLQTNNEKTNHKAISNSSTTHSSNRHSATDKQQTTHNTDSKANTAATTTSQQEEEEEEEETYSVSASISSLSACVIASTAFYLVNEKQIVESLNAAEQLRAEASIERAKREACESGRRQGEEFEIQRQQQLFNNMMTLHNTTAARFCHQLFAEAIETATQQQAKQQNDIQMQVIESMLIHLESQHSSTHEIVSEVVDNFLLTQVERQLQDRQRQRITAAAESEALQLTQQAIHSTLNSSTKETNIRSH